MKKFSKVNYQQTGESTSVNNMGCRLCKLAPSNLVIVSILLLKAPPASGKSRALMFWVLDKIQPRVKQSYCSCT